MGQPEDIAGTVAWLLSADARGVTGQAIDQNGGALDRVDGEGRRGAPPSASMSYAAGSGASPWSPRACCLELLELLLRPHPDGALEPVLGRDEPPAAEEDECAAHE